MDIGNLGMRAQYALPDYPGAKYAVSHLAAVLQDFASTGDERLVEDWVRHESRSANGTEISMLVDMMSGAIARDTSDSAAVIGGKMDVIRDVVSRSLPERMDANPDPAIERLIGALLSTVAVVNPNLREHLDGTGAFAHRIALAMGLSPAQAFYARNGGLLHDVGKLRIPLNILEKPGKLTNDEFDLVKRHSLYGERIIANIPGLERFCQVAHSHHESVDGWGYPDGLQKEQIPIEIRVIAVADAFNSMTSSRPYRKALPPSVALDTLMAGSGVKWDAEVVECVARLVSRPLGVQNVAA